MSCWNSHLTLIWKLNHVRIYFIFYTFPRRQMKPNTLKILTNKKQKKRIVALLWYVIVSHRSIPSWFICGNKLIITSFIYSLNPQNFSAKTFHIFRTHGSQLLEYFVFLDKGRIIAWDITLIYPYLPGWVSVLEGDTGTKKKKKKTNTWISEKLLNLLHKIFFLTEWRFHLTSFIRTLKFTKENLKSFIICADYEPILSSWWF